MGSEERVKLTMIFDLHVCDAKTALEDAETVVLCGRISALKQRSYADLLSIAAQTHITHLLESMKPGDNGAIASSYVPEDGQTLYVIGVSDKSSRHNHSLHPHAITDRLWATNHEKKRVVLALTDKIDDALVCTNAVARALPVFSRKTEVGDRQETVRLAFLGRAQDAESLERLQIAAEEVRYAARLVDMPMKEN